MMYVLVVVFALAGDELAISGQMGGRYRDEAECRFAAEVVEKQFAARMANGARVVCVPYRVGKPA